MVVENIAIVEEKVCRVVVILGIDKVDRVYKISFSFKT